MMNVDSGNSKIFEQNRIVVIKDDPIILLINYICAISSLLLMIVPILQGYLFGTYYSFFMILTMGGWLASSFLLSLNFLKKTNGLFVAILCIPLLYIFFALLGLGNIRNMVINIAVPYYAYIVFFFYYTTKRKTGLAIIAGFVFSGFIITTISTLIAVFENPYITREIENVTIKIENYKNNIGTVNHVYAASIIGILIACFLQGGAFKKRMTKVLAVIIMIICFWLGITGSSGITLIATILACIYLLLQKQKAYVRFFVVLLTGIFLLLVEEWIVLLLVNISQEIDNKYLAQKIYDIAQTMVEGDAVGSFSDRVVRWQADIQVGIDTFFIGAGPIYQGKAIGFWNTVYHVNDHSQLFGDFARYGILFTVFIICLFIKFQQQIKLIAKEEQINCKFGALWLMVSIMYISQPIFLNYIIPVLLLFLVPSSLFLIKKLQKN